MRKLLILRPEPGASMSARRARSAGLEPVICPLFAVQPVAWAPPDPTAFDALLLTSANAIRHGGPELHLLRGLPVLAVGEATATAARGDGFIVEAVGTSGADDLLGSIPGEKALLHLTGEHHHSVQGRHRVETVNVYRAAAVEDPQMPDTAGMVAAVHSPRAGARLAELVAGRSEVIIAAISEAAALACGTGWQAVEWTDRPSDSELLALAARLCQSPGQ